MEESQASERLEGATCGTGGPRSSSRMWKHRHEPNPQLNVFIGFIKLRKVQRMFGLVIVVCAVLIIYNLMPARRVIGIHSAISCKSKIAQIVMPEDRERQSYIEGFSKDAMSIENDFFHYMTSLSRTCSTQMHLGPEGDGGWEVCLDEQYDIRDPCLVYSFGVADEEFLFEKSVEEKLGCEVHAFDPSMGIESLQFSNKGFFHDYGLDSANTFAFNGQWKLRRLKTIMEELNHEGRSLDLLKMDIEFSEWAALHDMLQTGLTKNIRQLVMEIHTPEMDIHVKPDHLCTWSTHDTLAFMLKTLIDLQNVGFSVYYISPNHRTSFKSGITDVERLCCYNLHLVNTRHYDNQVVIHE
ncbi:hypothetical protein CAPTEDRAFT_228674 [Capitella teleta]|uniref:Methyltransferase domain-containing protein n=1 Tax=Capitella teleta TaxID=283909 RepID=R7VI82_CAPTE|nr:hypothetical protein CAPTEDRAFT_228674 [Capitella teleta]|eukprot:ELU18242.1 hypothetical protein CAPTEDRAFT_228674 [Capitella teleta]